MDGVSFFQFSKRTPDRQRGGKPLAQNVPTFIVYGERRAFSPLTKQELLSSIWLNDLTTNQLLVYAHGQDELVLQHVRFGCIKSFLNQVRMLTHHALFNQLVGALSRLLLECELLLGGFLPLECKVWIRFKWFFGVPRNRFLMDCPVLYCTRLPVKDVRAIAFVWVVDGGNSHPFVHDQIVNDKPMGFCKLVEVHLARPFAYAMTRDLIHPIVSFDGGCIFSCNPRGQTPNFSLYLCAAHPSLYPRVFA